VQHLNGIYWLLANVPAWATTLVLSTGTLTALFVGRHRLERMPYQVSYSAQIGEGVFFVVIVLIAEGILARGGTVPDWLYELDGDAHIALMVVCVVVGLLVSYATIELRSGQAMDIYHDVVIGPAIAYCAFTLLPLISTSGTDLEWGVTVRVGGDGRAYQPLGGTRVLRHLGQALEPARVAHRTWSPCLE